MAHSYSAEAIVINRRNFGEADRIVTLLLKYKGKFDAIAKGVRKVSSRRGPNLDLLNQVKAHFAIGKNLDVITEVQTLNSFKKAKEDLDRVSSGFYIAEIVNEFLAEGQGGREVFNLLLYTLRELDKETDLEKIRKVLRAFEIKFLHIIGYKPQLSRCVRCGDKLVTSGNFISPEAGGTLNEKCAIQTISKKPISNDAIKILRFLQEESWEKIDKLIISSGLNLELERHLRFYIEYLLEKELKSANFIEQIKRQPQT